MYFRIACTEHTGHDTTFKLTGAYSQALALIKSPANLNVTPSQYVYSVRDLGLKITIPQEKALKRKFARLRTHLKIGHMGAGISTTTYAALEKNIEKLKKINIEIFDKHTVYLLGNEYLLDTTIKPHRILACLFSENLLLNAYRQMQYGNQVKIYVDCSYRYMVEGWGVMIVKVGAFNQKGHTVAYAMISKEDSSAHKFVFKTIKLELEKIVNEKIAKNIKYI